MSTTTPRPWRRGQSTGACAAARDPLQTWRVTTAVRVFGLALIAGLALNAEGMRSTGATLVALVVVSGACCAGELQSSRLQEPWTTLAEGLLVGVLIGSSSREVEPLLAYLAVPPVVAGVRRGFVATTTTWIAVVLSLVVAETARLTPGELAGQVAPSVPWLVIGLGSGLLAAQQTRSLRRMAAVQAPYAAAHRLVGHLHRLVHDMSVELEVEHHGRAIEQAIGSLGVTDSVILVRGTGGRLAPVSSTLPLSTAEGEAGQLCVLHGQLLQRRGALAFPLRVGQHVFGAVVVRLGASVAHLDTVALQQSLDEHAIGLETALLVEDIRSVATSEERGRLAREIHDGVAQRIVALGYLADEVAATCAGRAGRDAAQQLREELTGLIAELRFSVFDLRHEVDAAGGLAAALTHYVQELSAHSPLRVHLTLDEQDARLPRRSETDLLRIAQEAIGNVHRHARAINVWVSLRVTGREVQLVVEDDGIGGAVPRVGHYGMHTMRERAEHIDADLEIGTRPDGGTSVTVRSRSTANPTSGARNDKCLARR